MRKHEIEVPLEATPEQVWEAITNADELMSWFAPEVRVTPGEGGSITLSWGPGMEGTAPIKVWEPGRRVVWVEGEGTENPKTVEFQIETKDGRTVLRLVNSGFGEGASFDAEYDSVLGGWNTFFAMLQYKLAYFAGTPAKNVALFNMSKLPRLATWDRFLKLTAITSTDEGDTYEARIGSLAVRGEVFRKIKPGYVCLKVSSLDDSLLNVFIEGGGEHAFVTFEWILYGEASIRRHEAEVRAAIESCSRELCELTLG